MAGAIKTVTFLVLLFAATVFAEDYDVGDDTEWTRPTNPNFYSNWAAGKTFRVGDILDFEFPNGAHDVAVVRKEAYDSCNKANPIRLFTTSPVRITLNTTGPHYYICTIGDHCTAGQKLSVNVVGANGRAAPAPRSNTAPGPLAPTTPGPLAPTTPSRPTTGPSPPNSASSLGGAAFLVSLLSFAVALLC